MDDEQKVEEGVTVGVTGPEAEEVEAAPETVVEETDEAPAE